MEGKYIYGIIKTGDEAARGITGLGGLGLVHIIACQGVGCVASDYSGREFGSMSREEVIRCLLAHQLVVEQVMKEKAVLPVKFGTVLATFGEVRGMLSQGYSQFIASLGWLQDKVEVEVAATWNREQVLREISAEPEIVAAREALASKPQTLEERLRLGQMVKVAMDRRRDSYRERMMNFLKPVALDAQPNALVSDEMVMNVAFLVEKARQEEFDCRVRQLNDLFHNQIRFRIIGPLPPYTFATVEITRLSPEKIELARQLLQLEGVLSVPEVRRAYRYLAAGAHPDRNPGDELAKKRFAELHQASDLLLAYCRGGVEAGGGLLINIKRLKNEEVLHLSFAEIGVGVASG